MNNPQAPSSNETSLDQPRDVRYASAKANIAKGALMMATSLPFLELAVNYPDSPTLQAAGIVIPYVTITYGLSKALTTKKRLEHTSTTITSKNDLHQGLFEAHEAMMQIPVDDKPSGRELLGRFIKDKEYRKTVFTNFLKDESSPGTKIIDENKVSARRIAAVQAEVFNLALNLPTVDKKGRPNAEYTMQTHDAIINTLEDVKKLGLISDLSVEKSGKKSRLRLVKLAIGSVSVKNLLVSFTGKTNADLVLPRQDIADVKFTVNDGVKITRENISEMSKGNKTLARFIKYEKRGILRFEYDDDGNLRYILPTTRKEQLKIERDRTET